MSLYSSDIIPADLAMMRNPFTASAWSASVDFSEEFIDVLNHSIDKDLTGLFIPFQQQDDALLS